MGAMTAGSAATGIKAWLEVHAPGFLTSKNAMRAAKVALIASWVITAGMFGTGS